MPFHVVGRVPSRGVMIAIPPWACGQSGSGILPLDAIQPEPGRLCHLAAAGRGERHEGGAIWDRGRPRPLCMKRASSSDCGPRIRPMPSPECMAADNLVSGFLSPDTAGAR